MPYYPQGYQAPYQNGVMSAPMMAHPNGLPPMQHAGLPEMAGSQLPKRKQVKNACTNCQKACKKCDDARPCPRCVKYGIHDSCVNSVRKERKKGIKRGPYKRRVKGGEEKKKTEEGNAPAAPYGGPMRGYAFGYPGNLNQYGQPYDPYSQYAAYHKDQMMSQPYVVNPYPPMGYPVMVANGEQPPATQTQSQPANGAHPPPHPPNGAHPYPPYMMQPQAGMGRPPMMHGAEHYPGGMYYPPPPPPPQSQSQPTSNRNSPHLPHKNESAPEYNKPQAMTTPIPSTTTSSTTTSSPESAH
ncbi:hypothetical protein BY458DRAFT_489189 [Sporodiniella umbellata]|nr:hypothetical protein BY458DRAFT_489189 [Sporodiniella umbellata]